MKNHIHKLLSILLLGTSASAAIASAPKSGVLKHFARQERQVDNTFVTYDHLREFLKLVYAQSTRSREFVADFYHRFLGLSAWQRSTISNEGGVLVRIIRAYFIYCFAPLSPEEREEAIREARANLGDDPNFGWALSEFTQVIQSAANRGYDLNDVQTLRNIDLLPPTSLDDIFSDAKDIYRRHKNRADPNPKQ